MAFSILSFHLHLIQKKKKKIKGICTTCALFTVEKKIKGKQAPAYMAQTPSRQLGPNFELKELVSKDNISVML